jgi:hypothetical protein
LHGFIILYKTKNPVQKYFLRGLENLRFIWHTYIALGNGTATRRIVTIAKAIRPITYKETPGKDGAFLLISR